VSAAEIATAAQPLANGKKRKAETTPRTERIATQHVGEDALESVGESPRPKRRATKKLKVADEVGDEFAAQESGDGEGKSKKAVVRRTKEIAATEKTIAEDQPKPKAKTKTKIAKILPPRAERTKDIKHRIGAHVSIAGG
jgi:AP endonuclease-1